MAPSATDAAPTWSFATTLKSNGHNKTLSQHPEMPQTTIPGTELENIPFRGTTATMDKDGVPNAMTLISLFYTIKETVMQDFAVFEKHLENFNGSDFGASKGATAPEEAESVDQEKADGAGQNGKAKDLFVGVVGQKSPLVDIDATNDTWKPLAIRRLKPLSSSSNLPQALLPLPFSSKPLQTFTLAFLTSVLGGSECSPGFYFPATGPPPTSTATQTNKALLPKSKTYYAIDARFDPFVPQAPGDHGAKLSVLFRDLENPGKRYTNVPLFVCLGPSPTTDDNNNDGAVQPPAAEKQYTYLGNYTQSRWSDKLDHDRVAELVPQHVKVWWAEKLAAHPDRPMWIEDALMEVFWPAPTYEGVLPEGEGTTVTEETVKSGGKVKEGKEAEEVREFLRDLKEHRVDSRLKAGLLKKEHILKAFEREDAAEEPGLRFWWEYLECVSFDRSFYYMLSTIKNHPTI